MKAMSPSIRMNMTNLVATWQRPHLTSIWLRWMLVAITFALSGCAELGLPNPTQPPRAETTRASEYQQVITVLKPIDNLPVTITHEGGIRYRLQVKNNSSDLHKLIWDDSSYVSTSGISIRLIRLSGKKIPDNVLAPQATAPIAAHSEYQTSFSGDRWIELAQEGGLPRPKDALRKGLFSLVFASRGKRLEWQGEMAFVAKKNRP